MKKMKNKCNGQGIQNRNARYETYRPCAPTARHGANGNGTQKNGCPKKTQVGRHRRQSLPLAADTVGRFYLD